MSTIIDANFLYLLLLLWQLPAVNRKVIKSEFPQTMKPDDEQESHTHLQRQLLWYDGQKNIDGYRELSILSSNYGPKES